MPAGTWVGGNGRYLDAFKEGVRDHFVYTLYGENDTVLYVGCTRRPEKRWREHRSGSNRKMIAQVVRKKMSGPYDYLTARRLEREQQIALRPTYGMPRRRVGFSPA